MGISFRNCGCSALLPFYRKLMLSYFHKDRNGICVSHRDPLLWSPYLLWYRHLGKQLPGAAPSNLQEYSPEAMLSVEWRAVIEHWGTTQFKTPLTTFACQQPSQDFLRASMQYETQPTQASFLPSLLSQVSQQHNGLKSSCPPPPAPLPFIL